MNNKIGIYLMNEKGYYVLNQLIKEFVSSIIDFVVSARDNNICHDYYNEIQELCKKNNLLFFEKDKKPQNVNSNFTFAIGWRWLIDTNNTTLVVFHDSILPRFRGFNPLVSALIKGERQIGVTALIGTRKYDNGSIIAQQFIEIDYPIKIYDVIQKIKPIYYELAREIIKDILSGNELRRIKQNEDEATYSLWRDQEDYLINWSNDADYIKRFIDSVGYPYQGASTFLNGKLVRVLDAEVYPDVSIENRNPGKVIFIEDEKPIVVCGKGLLKITKLLDDETRQSILPLTKFRTRFRNSIDKNL